ncbi:MAG: hypothetical protein HKO66_12115 [Saprospiraceae bacterium]|nr:hypothetical protein [Saprospiraceae bacterium]
MKSLQSIVNKEMKKLQDIENQLRVLEKDRKALHAKSKKITPWLILIPILYFLFSAAFLKVGPFTIISSVFLGIVSAIIYSIRVRSPFSNIIKDLKFSLIDSFIKEYHPNIKFNYAQHSRNGKSIIRSTGLIGADKYFEEDVIQGENKDVKFYISEVHLKSESNDAMVTVFKGILFKINLPNRNFPKTIIQSRPGLLNKIFRSFEKNEKYDFWYDTNDESRFIKTLGPLFPFLKHLIERQDVIRLKAEGNEIILMLETGMRFLDEPKPKLSRTFFEKEFANRLGQQLNSLLFIVESFANNLGQTEIEERLELKAFEYLKAD